MNKQVTEAYSYYKELSPQMIVFFRVRDNFYAYFDDAQIIERSLKTPLIPIDATGYPAHVSIPANQALEIVEQLHCLGHAAKMVSCRNSDGNFDIPDVKSLQLEQNMDQ